MTYFIVPVLSETFWLKSDLWGCSISKICKITTVIEMRTLTWSQTHSNALF